MKMKIAILAACASTFALSQADVARAYYGPTPDSSGVVRATTATPLLRINGQAVLDVGRIRVANKYADDFKQINTKLDALKNKKGSGARGLTTPSPSKRTITIPAVSSPSSHQSVPSKN